MNTILLIEDNVRILETNREYLESEGYTVCAAATLAEGRRVLQRESIDLLVLDIMLPDGSGIDFCESIRGQCSVPVLYLTCLEEEAALVRALKAGGDEYMTKPYKLEALSARIMAMLRRVRIERTTQENFEIGPLTVDCAARTMYLGGENMLLKPKEFDLLLTLLRSMDREFTAEELYSAVWREATVDTRTVAVHLSNLRKKLENSPFVIVTKKRKYYSLVMELGEAGNR